MLPELDLEHFPISLRHPLVTRDMIRGPAFSKRQEKPAGSRIKSAVMVDQIGREPL